MVSNNAYMIKESNCKVDYRELLFFLVYGAIALSSWSYYILCDLIGIPFYLYEVYFIPLAIKYRRQLLKYNFCCKFTVGAWVAAIVIVVFFILGIVINPNYAVAHITTYRTIFYIFAGILIVSSWTRFNITILQCLCVGSCLGQFAYMSTIATNANETAVNIVALSLMIIIPSAKGNVKQTMLYTAFGLFLAFRSSFRINIVVVLISLGITLFLSWFVTKSRKLFMFIGFLVIAGLVIIANLDAITAWMVDVLKMSNAMSIYRITARLKALFSLDFEQSQDMVRFELMGKMFTSFSEYLLPTGLIGKAIGEYGIYKDAPIIYIYSAFGSVVGLLLTVFVAVKGLLYMIKSVVQKQQGQLVFGSMLVVYIILFLLNGTFLIATYDACLTGVVFGVWLNKKNLKFV